MDFSLHNRLSTKGKGGSIVDQKGTNADVVELNPTDKI